MTVSATLLDAYGHTLATFNLDILPEERRGILSPFGVETVFQTAQSFGKSLLLGLRWRLQSNRAGSKKPLTSKRRPARQAGKGGSRAKKRRG
jgi:hypothetical protein